MVALTLALAASVAWGSSDFLAGVKARNVAVLTVLLVSQVAGLTEVLALLGEEDMGIGAIREQLEGLARQQDAAAAPRVHGPIH